jgi:hypothetical protein
VTAEAEQAILEFLGEVTTLAQGQMTPQNRNQLISWLRGEINSRAASRNATKASEIRQILLGMGTPQALVMVEANKDPLFRARQRERERQRAGSVGYGAGSVFSPEVDPTVARMVTPGSLSNPPSDRFGGSSGGSVLPGPEVPLEPDPFGAGAGEWMGGEEAGESTLTPVPMGGGPQVPLENGGRRSTGGGGSSGGGGGGASRGGAAPYSFGAPGSGPWVRNFGEKAARSHTQALVAVFVLFGGAVADAVVVSPYTIAVVLLGYLLAMTSYSFTSAEKRFALIGVPITAILFYAFGLFLARGRSTGHSTPINSSDTWQAARDGLTAVPTMLGLLSALYLLWRLFRAVAKSG